jgi:hypothetical protein
MESRDQRTRPVVASDADVHPEAPLDTINRLPVALGAGLTWHQPPATDHPVRWPTSDVHAATARNGTLPTPIDASTSADVGRRRRPNQSTWSVTPTSSQR